MPLVFKCEGPDCGNILNKDCQRKICATCNVEVGFCCYQFFKVCEWCEGYICPRCVIFKSPYCADCYSNYYIDCASCGEQTFDPVKEFYIESSGCGHSVCKKEECQNVKNEKIYCSYCIKKEMKKKNKVEKIK